MRESQVRDRMTDVKTVATARRRSLIKWSRVKVFFTDLFNEIDTSCGFCDLGVYLSKKEEGRERCDNCVVVERCKMIQETSSNLEDKMTKLIEDTLEFLEDMDVKEK